MGGFGGMESRTKLDLELGLSLARSKKIELAKNQFKFYFQFVV